MSAPKTIWVDFFDEPTSSWCGDAFSTDSGDTEYVRRDPAVLAALPEVQALVAAAQADALLDAIDAARNTQVNDYADTDYIVEALRALIQEVKP